MHKTAHAQKNPDAGTKEALIRTLVYSHLFSFPLTREELWKYLKAESKIPKQSFEANLVHLPQTIEQYQGYYFLAGNKNFVELRERRKKISRKKILLAKNTATLLAKIPSIHFIGISGSLASKNADDTDDIDLFVITRKHTLWISRILALLLLSILGKRRKKNTTAAKDTVCINMLLEKDHLLLPPARQDVYTAHEIAQLYPLINKNNTYEAFLKANAWIKTFLPNIFDTQKPHPQTYYLQVTFPKVLQTLLLETPIRALDISTKIPQLWKINKSRTTETITDTLLAFHPADPKKMLLETYRKRLKRFGITS